MNAPTHLAQRPHRYLSRLALTAALTSALACAQDRPEINEVQPNAVKKADILGREWYLRNTVVHASFTSASSFPGAMSSLVRGVFEVQEKNLIFYRTYEFQVGSEAYAQRSDVDIAVKDAKGKPVVSAMPEDYQKIKCAPGDNSTCGKDAWCADAAKPTLTGEEDWHGFCVRKTPRYVYRGAPMWAWAISHFDVQYAYSAATGETTNVKGENTTDRKWYQREYMRVAWGAGTVLSEEVNAAGLAGTFGSLYEGDVAPEDEQFEMSETQSPEYGTQKTITFMNRWVVGAPTTYLSGFGMIPICFFYPWYIGGVFDCTSEEIRARSYFLEVPQYKAGDERRYVSREMDDVEFEKFGFFRSERPAFDIEFGNIFNNAVRRAQRHRIWDKYVKCYVDPKASVVDGMEGNNACKPAGSAGAMWKGGFDYTKMSPVPIVYYLNDDHPRELVKQSVEIGEAWSDPYNQVVEFRKGKKPDFPMFIVCENSSLAGVKAKSEGAATAEYPDLKLGSKTYAGTKYGKYCRNMSQPHRFGDLRYSFMHAVPAPNQAGLYGYGPSAADPITGETISASAHAYSGVMKLGAEAAMQAIELQSGIKDFNDIKRASEKLFNVSRAVKRGYDTKVPKSTTDVQGMVKNLIDPDVRQRLETLGLEHGDDAGTWAQSRMARIQSNPSIDAMLVSGDDSYFAHTLFKDPRVKAGTASTVSPDDLKRMSIAEWGHTAAIRAREKVVAELGKRTIHLADFADGALVGMAEEYGRRFDAEICKAYLDAKVPTIFDNFKDGSRATSDACAKAGDYESQGTAKGRICRTNGPDLRWHRCSTADLMQDLRLAVNQANAAQPNAEKYRFLPGPLYSDTTDETVRVTQEIGREVVQRLREEVKLELWQRIYKGTQLHEVGHTLGLRHNFEASTDALNYHRKYWELKLDSNNRTDVVNPWQQDTPEQGREHIRTQQLASVMDYTAKFNGRDQGVGLYDKAALKFAYGDMVETFANPPALDTAPPAAVGLAGGGDLPPLKDYLATPNDENPAVTMVTQQGTHPMNILTRRVHWSSLPRYFASGKGAKDAIDNMYNRKHVAWSDLKGDRCAADADCAAGSQCQAMGEEKFCAKTKGANGAAIVEVPYRFCSDEINGQTATCATGDEGADAYEIARNSLDDYEQYWYFYGYSRDSETFHTNNYSGRVQGAFWRATRQFQYWMVDFATYNKNGWWKKRYGREWDQDPNGGLAGSYAMLNTFNTMAGVLQRPSPGIYAWNAKRLRFEPYNNYDQNTGDPHYLDETSGSRQLYGGWGGGYLQRPTSGGQIYDRLAAFIFLSDPTMARFQAVNESEDQRRFLVSFFSAFPRQLMNIYSAINVEDENPVGWLMLHGGTEVADDDIIVAPTFVGPGAEQQRKACADAKAFPPGTVAADMKGCIKYRIYPDARPFFPSSRFRMPLLAAQYGMALLQRGWDRSFMDVSRIFLKGNQAAITLPGGTEKCEFTDPLSGKTYIAQKTSTDLMNPGCLAVKAAQKELDKFPDLATLQASYLFSEYQFRVSLLDLMRSMHATYEL